MFDQEGSCSTVVNNTLEEFSLGREYFSFFFTSHRDLGPEVAGERPTTCPYPCLAGGMRPLQEPGLHLPSALSQKHVGSPGPDNNSGSSQMPVNLSTWVKVGFRTVTKLGLVPAFLFLRSLVCQGKCPCGEGSHSIPQPSVLPWTMCWSTKHRRRPTQSPWTPNGP